MARFTDKETAWERYLRTLAQATGGSMQVVDRDAAAIRRMGLRPEMCRDIEVYLSHLTSAPRTLSLFSVALELHRLGMHDLDTEEGQNNVHIAMAVAALATYGYKTYVVAPRLMDGLLETNLREVPADLIKCPYPAFYIQFARSPFTIFNPLTGEHRMDGVYVMDGADTRPGGVGPTLMFLFAGDANENSKHENDDATFWFGLPRSDIHGDVESIAERLEARTSQRGWGGGNVERVPDYLRLILNTLLYIDAENADVVQTINPGYVKAQKHAARGMKRAIEDIKTGRVKPRDFIVLGGRLADDMIPAGVYVGGQEGRVLHTRHIVRGHWRVVRFGPGSLSVRPAWIQPYWRGPTIVDLAHGRRGGEHE